MNYVFIIGIIQLVFCYCIDTVLLQIHICNCELRFFYLKKFTLKNPKKKTTIIAVQMLKTTFFVILFAPIRKK